MQIFYVRNRLHAIKDQNNAHKFRLQTPRGDNRSRMNTRSILQRYDLHAIQQRVKWTIYTILVVNFSFYVLDDMELARHSLREGASFLSWTTTFATTIDELAWFMLLLLFELET